MFNFNVERMGNFDVEKSLCFKFACKYRGLRVFGVEECILNGEHCISCLLQWGTRSI